MKIRCCFFDQETTYDHSYNTDVYKTYTHEMRTTFLARTALYCPKGCLQYDKGPLYIYNVKSMCVVLSHL